MLARPNRNLIKKSSNLLRRSGETSAGSQSKLSNKAHEKTLLEAE
jgi:hypothetical protein